MRTLQLRWPSGRDAVFVSFLLLPGTVLAQEEEPPRPAGLDSAHVGTRAKAVRALGASGHPRAFEWLRAALDDERTLVQAYACEGLAELGDPRAIPALRSELRTIYSQVWRAAATSLARFGDRASFDEILRRVHGERDNWRAYGDPIDSLLTLDRERALPIVLEMLLDPALNQQVSLAGSLAKLGDDPEVRDRATALLDHERESLRCAGMQILGGVGDLRSVSLLLRYLSRDNLADREAFACLEALGSLGNELAVPSITALLSGSHDSWRASAIRALEQIGHPSAQPALSRLLEREEHDLLLVVQALGAVGTIGHEAALPAVALWLDDTHFTAQPLDISSVHGFPYNTRVCDAAAWAARTLLDGMPPLERDALIGFPTAKQCFTPEARASLRQRITGRAP